MRHGSDFRQYINGRQEPARGSITLVSLGEYYGRTARRCRSFLFLHDVDGIASLFGLLAFANIVAIGIMLAVRFPTRPIEHAVADQSRVMGR